ncbi:hypothetical protein GCM10020000_55200 [Streptomyces olivoverticillatus]
MTETQALIENRPPSVASLFLERVEATPEAEAYRYPVPAPSGQGPDSWASLTWRDAADRVFAIAAGLIDLGVRPEERVALASGTRVEWILADLGVMCAGAATTPRLPQHQRRGDRLHARRRRVQGDHRRGRRPARQGAQAPRRAARPRPRRRHRRR